MAVLKIPEKSSLKKILALLYSLMEKPVQKLCLFIAPSHLKSIENIRALLQIHACYYAYLHEHYQHMDFTLQFEFKLLAEHKTIFEIEQNGEPFTHEQIVNALNKGQGHSELSLKQVFSLLDSCAREWLNCEDWQILWQGESGAIYRCLQDMQLWRYGLWSHEAKVLNETQRKIFNEPFQPNYYMILLLYKRWFNSDNINTVSPQIRAVFEYYKLKNRGHLQLLPPPATYDVTVIILTYNRLEKLKGSLRSVLNQTHPPAQIIIADGGSTDGTREYVQKIQETYPLVHYLFRDLPPGSQSIRDMWSLACEESPTELIVLVPDDDEIKPNGLEKTTDFFQTHPWVAMVAGGYHLIESTQNQEIKHTQFGPYYAIDRAADPRIELQRAALFNPIYGGGVLYRKALLKELAPFESKNSRYAGWDWLITVLTLQKYEVGMVRDILANYNIESQSQESFKTDFWVEKGTDLMTYIITGYESLVGEQSYPEYCLNYYEEHMSLAKRFGESFYQLLTHEIDGLHFKSRASTLSDKWQAWLEFKTHFRQTHSSLRDLCIFEHQNSHAMGITQGKVQP